MKKLSPLKLNFPLEFHLCVATCKFKAVKQKRKFIDFIANLYYNNCIYILKYFIDICKVSAKQYKSILY